MEINYRWLNALESLKEQYAHHRVVARPDNFGIAVFIDKPVEEIFIRTPIRPFLPVVSARFKHNGKTVHFTGLHTLPPASRAYFHGRNELLKKEAKTVRNQTNPRVVMGDLNTTSWSPHFQSFLDTTQLRDSRKGYGVQPTWPAFLYLAPLRICLDHCLVSDDLKVVNRTVLHSVGSDHYPILVSLQQRK